jgi:signal transduction histidine kinase
MENLRINAGQARETLAQLQAKIHRQRRSLLQNGDVSEALAAQLESWERMVQQLQTEMMLEKSAQLSMLYEVTNSINASLDWRPTLQAVMDAVIQITEAERGMLLVFDAANELQVEMTSNATQEPFTDEDLKYSYSVVQEAIQRLSPILTTNAQIDPRFQESESIVAYGLRSILCTPLLHAGEPLGVIYLDNRAREGVFAQEDMATLDAFARQASVAIANAQQHKQTDQALTEKVRELTILQEMARDLNSSQNFNRVMERSVAWAIAAAGAEAGAIGLIAEEGIRWLANVGNMNPDDGIALQRIYRREPLLEDARLVLPLYRDNRPIGALYMTAEERGLKKSKLEFVMRVADNVAIAVENARLYEALRQANLAKSEFVSVVSQELRTPMTSIRGYADMLNKGLVGDLTERQQEFIQAIRRNVSRMRALVSDLLDISSIETGRLRVKAYAVDFKEALHEALLRTQDTIEEKDQTLNLDIWDGLPRAHADPNRLTQILTNLLNNASKYTPEGGSISVRAWLLPEEPDFIRCAVADTGIGISREDQARIFTKFYRVDTPEVRGQPGTGLGLSITKHLVEMHGGRIWVESTPSKGSIFFFTVPIAMPEGGV